MNSLFYPHDLAGLIRERWGSATQSAPRSESGIGQWQEAIMHTTGSSWSAEPQPPSHEMLEELLMNCHQASLLREEQRPVTFRLLLANPEKFYHDEGPPDGLHCLPFQSTRPLNPLELRRLSPAADYYRSMLGVNWDNEKGLRIWGIIHSGLRWLQNFHGGRGRIQDLPPALIVSVSGPGRLTIGFGSQVIAQVEGGQVSGPSVNVFDSQWLRASFAGVREEVWQLHTHLRAQITKPWAALNPTVIRIIAQYLLRRVISAVRSAEHGATILLLPMEIAEDCCSNSGLIDLKYRFAQGEPRSRFVTLMMRILERLAELHGNSDPNTVVGWTEYALSTDEKLDELNEAIMEMSYLIAGCAEVDGAVVLTKRYELLGFGGEISGMLPNVAVVHQALDLEGTKFVEESTESVGTRHRSTYRLCQAMPDVVAIVVSQDGGVRFVKNINQTVTYWDQTSTTSLDV